jgi:hypothetical protein
MRRDGGDYSSILLNHLYRNEDAELHCIPKRHIWTSTQKYKRSTKYVEERTSVLLRRELSISSIDRHAIGTRRLMLSIGGLSINLHPDSVINKVCSCLVECRPISVSLTNSL